MTIQLEHLNKVIGAIRHFRNFEEGMRSLGFEECGRGADYTIATEMVWDLALDLLGVPEDNVTRPDIAAELRKLDELVANNECDFQEYHAQLPADFYCRDYLNDILSDVVDGKCGISDLLNAVQQQSELTP